MKVTNVEKKENSTVELTIHVEADEFEAAVQKAYLKSRSRIAVPGFRKGKAPRKIIEGMYGAEVFFEEAINIAFPEAYEAAVKEQELQVVGYPSVEIEGQVTRDGFTFKATAPVYPEVTLGQYKGLSAPKEEVKVSAADVDERLKALTDRNTRLVSVDREITEQFLNRMRKGVKILDTVTRPCTVEKTGEKSFRIILTQGLNRQIRRMCEALGYRVRTLKRVRIMNLRLDGLKTGEYREITRGEWKELTELLEGKGERRKADQKNAEKHSELGQREPEKGGR